MSLGREGATVEFVDSMEDLDDGLRSMAAMLNRYHRAEILIGVDSDGETTGIDVGEEDLDAVRSRIRERMNTVPEATVASEQAENGDRYIRVSATGYDIPYSYDGWFRVRRYCVRKTGDGTVTEWKDLLTCGMKRHRPRGRVRAGPSSAAYGSDRALP